MPAQEMDPWTKAVIEQNRRWLMAFLLASTGDRAAAEDLTQEVFQIAFEKRSDFDTSADFGAWLRGIARNCLKRHFEKSRRRPVVVGDALCELEGAAAQAEPKLLDPDWVANRVMALRECLKNLTERARQILDARYVQNVSARDLGERMNMTVLAVNTAAFRARTVVAECVRRKLT
jgi:RNA polymerase sigma-70 factor (ECF subfamily)